MRVAVVGMGAAGIQAARILEAKGHSLELFDARDRVGGRLHTIESEGLLYDAGGEWIDADHKRSLELVADLGGRLYSREESEPYTFALQGEMRKEGAEWEEAKSDLQSLEAWAREQVASLATAADPDATQHAGKSVADAISQVCRSPLGRLLATAIYRSDEGEDLDRVGLQEWLLGFGNYVHREGLESSAFRVEGGMGALIRRAADTLESPFTPNARLLAVAQREHSVRLHFDGLTVDAGACILTMPPPQVACVSFDPPLPNPQLDAIRSMPMSRTIKIMLAFREPFWEQSGWSGFLHTDSPVQQTWTAPTSPTPVLICYVCGNNCDFWRRQSDPVGTAVEMIEATFPGAKRNFMKGNFHDWVADEWSRGGFCYLPPGYMNRHLANIPLRHGRVVFAGDHTATWKGFIEGALESAERAARDVSSLPA